MTIGKIISVEYDKFRVKLFHSTKNSTVSIDGHIYYFGNIGSYLKTYNSTGDAILCEVVSILDHSTESKVYSSFNLDSSRELVIKPIGTLNSKDEFEMGIGIFPSIYSDVSIVTVGDIDKILTETKTREVTKGIHYDIEIGYSKSLINYRISIDINKLFNIHTAVLGNSGSGKSNTIATILQKVYRKKNNCANGAKTILFDVNGEYLKAFDKEKLNSNITVLPYKPNNTDDKYTPFYLPYYLLNLDEWLAFLMASDKTQKPFWDRVLQECFKFYKIFNSETDVKSTEKYVNYFKWKIRGILSLIISQIDSDTAKVTAARGVILRCKEIVLNIYSDKALSDFLQEAENSCLLSFGNNSGGLAEFVKSTIVDDDNAIIINSQRLRPGDYFDYKYLRVAVDIVLLEEEARGNVRIRDFVSTLLSRLDYFMENPDCDFMRNSDRSIFQNTETYLKECFGIANETNKNQLIIIDSSEVGSDILELMTSVVSRMIYDYRKKKQNNERRECPIHLILDEAHRYIKKDADYILKENIFEKIAREGRKFSLYLLVSSQRPSELSSTVLSQCGNYIIHRIQNEIDMRYVYSVLPYFSDDYITKIKQAIPGEALIFGNCVPLPLQVMIDRANPDPNSDNCIINEEWFKEEI